MNTYHDGLVLQFRPKAKVRWIMRSVECGKWGVWKIGSVENEECGKCGEWKFLCNVTRRV